MLLPHPLPEPQQRLEKIAADAGQVISVSEFRDKFIHAAGLEVLNLHPGPFAEQLHADRASYAARLKALNIKLE